MLQNYKNNKKYSKNAHFPQQKKLGKVNAKVLFLVQHSNG